MNGTTAVVTGAAGGIGRALASELALSPVLADIDTSSLHEVVSGAQRLATGRRPQPPAAR
ncbi:hypothetical protein [Saccharopolyspora sp. SCSIO 74807]|uniref:hypothetical protein n=1 Tax=Saccharopolyspora sp. SCSIO 74807 TaxID=3118084 RepID=UPI0030D31494